MLAITKDTDKVLNALSRLGYEMKVVEIGDGVKVEGEI